MTMTTLKIKAPKEINGRIMRYCIKYNVWVNQEGNYVYREYNDPALNRSLVIHTRADGSKYLNTKSHGEIPLDEVVAICFKPMPKDGYEYRLIHKDGYIGNCSAYNLEWEKVITYLPTDTKRKLNNGIVVGIDGTIYDKNKKLTIQKTIGDRDIDMIVGITPMVEIDRKNKWGRYDSKRFDIDDLMADAEFVSGDRSKMQHPKVLHKNMDYLDFHADNLEWVEECSQEYQEYMKKKCDDINNLTIKCNPNIDKPILRMF